jgi:hypothetical protein
MLGLLLAENHNLKVVSQIHAAPYMQPEDIAIFILPSDPHIGHAAYRFTPPMKFKAKFRNWL